MGLKLGILLNKETNKILDHLAARMGTSKRNVILLGLSNILRNKISKEDLKEMVKRIRDMTHPTNITINEAYKKRLVEIERHGLSIRRFFGYIICDYFQRNYHEFGGGEKSVQDEKDFYNPVKGNVQTFIDKKMKKKVANYCSKHSISVNSLFAHYIMNRQVIGRDFESGEKELIHLTLGIDVKKRLSELSERRGMGEGFLVSLIAIQIIDDLRL